MSTFTRTPHVGRWRIPSTPPPPLPEERIEDPSQRAPLSLMLDALKTLYVTGGAKPSGERTDLLREILTTAYPPEGPALSLMSEKLLLPILGGMIRTFSSSHPIRRLLQKEMKARGALKEGDWLDRLLRRTWIHGSARNDYPRRFFRRFKNFRFQIVGEPPGLSVTNSPSVMGKGFGTEDTLGAVLRKLKALELSRVFRKDEKLMGRLRDFYSRHRHIGRSPSNERMLEDAAYLLMSPGAGTYRDALLQEVPHIRRYLSYTFKDPRIHQLVRTSLWSPNFRDIPQNVLDFIERELLKVNPTPSERLSRNVWSRLRKRPQESSRERRTRFGIDVALQEILGGHQELSGGYRRVIPLYGAPPKDVVLRAWEGPEGEWMKLREAMKEAHARTGIPFRPDRYGYGPGEYEEISSFMRDFLENEFGKRFVLYSPLRWGEYEMRIMRPEKDALFPDDYTSFLSSRLAVSEGSKEADLDAWMSAGSGRFRLRDIYSGLKGEVEKRRKELEDIYALMDKNSKAGGIKK